MIGKVFGGGDSNEPQLPKDVKDAISKCRGAVQKGLEDRISRMVCGMCTTYIIKWISGYPIITHTSSHVFSHIQWMLGY